METNTGIIALDRVASIPWLYQQVGRPLTAQARHIAEQIKLFVPRPELLAALDELLDRLPGGLIAIEGLPGSGITSLLCHLAATRPYAFWFPGTAGGAGVEALCAQLIALYNLPLALVPPAAGRDATTFERLLEEASMQRNTDERLIVIIDDPQANLAQQVPFAPLFPATLPAGVFVVAGCIPGATLPLTESARIRLPGDSELNAQLRVAASHQGAAPRIAELLTAYSGGSFLYVYLAGGLLASGLLNPLELPDGLEQLHQRWWSLLDASGRQLALLLAAAGEPLPVAYYAALSGHSADELERTIALWANLLDHDRETIALHHSITRTFIAQQSGDQLEQAHALHARFLENRLDGSPANPALFSEYAIRHFARHITLSDPATCATLGPMLESRSWMKAQERRTGGMQAGAHDLAWHLQTVARNGPVLRLVRAATIGGTLALLARSLPADALADSFAQTLERGYPREAALKRSRGILDQLPDGRDKAMALRRLGEVCYALRIRAPAMRMLSEAIDLEAQGLPRSWHDEREETLVAFARAAVAISAPDLALGITTLITHVERRGMIETEVVRWLLAHSQRTRAEEVAYAIGHAGNHEWAMAEVAVGHARVGDFERAGIVLGTLRTDTAIAWVTTELACDAALHGNPRAVDRVALLKNPALRDRALAQVTLALAKSNQVEEAFDSAAMIEDAEIHARALITMASECPSCTIRALDKASTIVASITGEERAPVIAALAAAHAESGRLERAIQTAELLPAGEEHDRAQSRIAVALARSGEALAAHTVALGIADDDERSWALDELARLMATAGQWREAFNLASQISDSEQRTRTEADLAIAWARNADPVAAHMRAEQIEHAGERARARNAIITPLIAVGARSQVHTTISELQHPDTRSRYQAAAVAAFALHGALQEAQDIAQTIVRPLDRARALVSITRAAAATGNRALADRALGAALREAARLGRTEILACLGWAADALALLGGAELLLTAAGALDEIDSWWT